ncbi:hypothetical protein F5Y16DRAFT_378159 [Xylariaceae sp. FL0255]|nr:hypothetical protein F5Y16DRAFT_378159 [Xylariaceae sp. FL0255]
MNIYTYTRFHFWILSLIYILSIGNYGHIKARKMMTSLLTSDQLSTLAVFYISCAMRYVAGGQAGISVE